MLRVSQIEPGAEFYFHGRKYVRARPEQRRRHLAYKRLLRHPVILAFAMDGTPVTFTVNTWVQEATT